MQLSTIRFQKVIQLIQILNLKFANSFKFIHNFLHHFQLIEKQSQILLYLIFVCRFHIFLNYMIHFVPFIDFFRDVLQSCIGALQIIHLNACIYEIFFFLLTKLSVFFLIVLDVLFLLNGIVIGVVVQNACFISYGRVID